MQVEAFNIYSGDRQSTLAKARGQSRQEMPKFETLKDLRDLKDHSYPSQQKHLETSPLQ